MKHFEMKKLLLILIFFPFIGMSQNGPFYFMDNNIQREYYLHVPNNLQANSAIIYAFHGWNGNGSSFMNTTNFNTLSDQNGFIVCYPTGLIDNFGYTAWDTEGITDINFITELNDSLTNFYQLDTSKVFATGYSYGAEMSYHISNCQTTKYFDAIAPLGGGTWDYVNNGWSVPCSPSINIPVFILNGTSDNEFNYYGGYYPNIGYYLSVDSTVSIWTDFNSCTFNSNYTLADLNNDNQLTEVTKYINPTNEIQVWLYKVNNGAHEWFDVSPLGSDDFWASEEIWNFFSQIPIISTVIDDNNTSNSRLIKSINVLGQPINSPSNSIIFNIYDDGRVEKRIVIE